MTLYVIIEIGCIECVEPSYLLGVYDSEEKAREALPQDNHYFQIFKLKKLNKEVRDFALNNYFEE